MRITLLYFAAARERAGTSRETLELLPDATARTALEAACANHPALAAIAHLLRVAVDQEFAAPDKALRDGCEVALIPPVSGGVDLPRAHAPGADRRAGRDLPGREAAESAREATKSSRGGR